MPVGDQLIAVILDLNQVAGMNIKLLWNNGHQRHDRHSTGGIIRATVAETEELFYSTTM